MKHVASVLRILFGLHFLINGLNFYLDLFPVDGAMGKPARMFVDQLVSSGLIELFKVTEVGVGIALLSNRFVPLAALIAMPVSVGIAFMDIVLIGGWFVGGVLGFGTLLLNALLMLCYFSHFQALLQPRSIPDAARPSQVSS